MALLPFWWEVLSVEDHVEYLDKEGCHPLGKMLQCLVWYISCLTNT